jgi:hypothetical protein
MADTKEIMEALSWFTAERFKSLQRKLTTARNTIQKEALSSKLRPFYTDAEIETLNEAARILGSAKRKIEHAKEIKAREEAARDRQLDACKRQRLALLSSALPKPSSEADARPMLLWVLALSLNHQDISRHAYFYEQKYIAGDIERAFGSKTKHTVLGNAVEWWREVTQFLEENLWPYDEEPDPARLKNIEALVNGEWGEQVLAHAGTRALVDHFDTEVAIAHSDTVHRL